jgi:two-component system nitrogen regulation response regulator GlnG/two-component system response regulator HydG
MTPKPSDQAYDPTPDQPLDVPSTIGTPSESLALLIAWNRTEPKRAGECAYLLPGSMVLGRGAARPDDGATRVAFGMMRPGLASRTAPLAAPSMSRAHVRLEADEDGIDFECVGRSPVALDGNKCDRGRMIPGSTLLVANEVLVICERLPRQPPEPALTRTPDFPFGGADHFAITGESPAAWRLRDQIRFAAGSAAPLLVIGPLGSGKHLVTRAAHAASAHRDRPYLVIGGATLTRAELEALQSRDDAPFIVIDEVGDASLEAYRSLSRLMAIAGSLPTPRLRIVATNSRPLVGPGAARASPPDPQREQILGDLASRFILTVSVPGLDQRRADIPLLARSLLREIATQQPEVGARFFEGWQPEANSGQPRLSPALVDRLVRHRWHAHVRELTSLLWSSMTTATEAWLDATPEVDAQLELAPSSEHRDPSTLDAHAVREALAAAQGKVAEAARILGLRNRWVLYRLMDKLDIPH